MKDLKVKGKLIDDICNALKQKADETRQHFDYGSTFFSLVFKTDNELNKIASLCGIKV